MNVSGYDSEDSEEDQFCYRNIDALIGFPHHQNFEHKFFKSSINSI
jgi:hypothetical protein